MPNSRKKPIVFYDFGSSYDMVYNQAQENVARRWGITFMLSGCIVTEEEMIESARNNKIMNARAYRRFGKGWRKKFEEEFSLELIRLQSSGIH